MSFLNNVLAHAALKKHDIPFIEKDKLDTPNLMSFEQTKDNKNNVFQWHLLWICTHFGIINLEHFLGCETLSTLSQFCQSRKNTGGINDINGCSLLYK